MVAFSRKSKRVNDGIQLRKIGIESANAISVETQETSLQLVNYQLDSPFFAKLPLEVRVLIYKYTIESWGWTTNTLHIVTKSQVTLPTAAPWEEPEAEIFPDGKLTCTPCASSLGDPFLITGTHYGAWPKGHLGCCRIANWRLDDLHTMEAQHLIQESKAVKAEIGPSTKMSLLLSCQRVYQEMSHLIYSNLEFNFLDIHTAVRFLSTIQPQNLATIRSVGLNWRVTPSDYLTPPESLIEPQDWMYLCKVFTDMPAITKLHIAIFECQYSERIREALEALLHISVHGGSFILELPSLEDWVPEGENGADIWESSLAAPFVIERRSPAVEGNVHMGVANIQGRTRPSRLYTIILSPCIITLFCWFILVDLGKCLVDQLKRLRR